MHPRQSLLSMLNDSSEISFKLLLSNKEEPNTELAICLLCQCKEQDAAALSIYARDPHEESQLYVQNHAIIFNILAFSGILEQGISFKEQQACQLYLEYEQTLIEVTGTAQSLAGAATEQLIEFHFDEPKSMQARMILQLVKICQMRTQLASESDCDLQQVAKRWTESFAADFANDFDEGATD